MSANVWNGHSTTNSHLRTSLTPYLTLPHLLSLSWLAAPILSLIFVVFRLQLSFTDAQNALDKTKVNLLASCLAAEQAATSTVSMPRYLALSTNKQFAKAANGSLEAARVTLILSITVLESVLNFVIDIYRSTFLCLLELVVRGGLSILIGAVDGFNQVIQTAAGALRTTLEQQISTANSAVQTIVDAINKLPGKDFDVPHIDVPNLDSLSSASLPSSFQEGLVKLNDTIPSASEIKQKLEDVLNTPFELLKKEINDTFLGLSFNPDGLPIPPQKGVTFCEKLDTSVVDDLNADLLKSVRLGFFILLAIAGFLLTMNCLLTWYRWRCLKRHFEYTRQAWLSDPTIIHPDSHGSVPHIPLNDHNLMMLGSESQNPFITRIMNQISTKFRLTPRQHIHGRWFFQYIFHAPAIACLLIGLFGLLSIELQLFALGPLISKYRGRAQNSVSDFNQLVASSINSSMQNQSSTYATEVNGRVIAIETTVNNGLFGWVNVTTTTLNNTINAVYKDVQDAVTLVFGGSILEDPAQQFVKCLIGSKVEAVEKAITFLHDNLQIDLPRVDQNVLVLSPESVDEATRPIAAAAIGGGANDDEGFLGQIIKAYVASLEKERFMFLIFIGLWVVVVLMGLLMVLWHSIRAPKDSEPEQKLFVYDHEKGGSVDSLSKESFLSKILALLQLCKPRPKKVKEKVKKPVKEKVQPEKKPVKEKVKPETKPVKEKVKPEKKPVKEKVKPEPKPKVEKPKKEFPKLVVPSLPSFSTPKLPDWKNLVPTPPKKPKEPPTVVPLPVAKPAPPIVVPRRRFSPLPPRITSKTPLLAEYMAFPIPLHTGFDNPQSRPHSSISLAMTSPQIVHYQIPLSPPPLPMVPQQLVPQVPLEPFESSDTDPQRGMTNANADLETSKDESKVEGEDAYSNLPMAKSLDTEDAKKSTISPFVTPFDDEHRNEPPV